MCSCLSETDALVSSLCIPFCHHLDRTTTKEPIFTYHVAKTRRKICDLQGKHTVTTPINYLLSTVLFIQETQYNNTNRGSQDVDSHMEKYPLYTFFCKKEICSQDKASLRVRGLGPNCYKIGEKQVQDGGNSDWMLLVNELLDPSAASSCVQFCLLNCVLMWYRDSFLQGRQQMVYSS